MPERKIMAGAGHVAWEKIMAKGHELLEAGKYMEASEILNRLFLAEPQNQEARELLADVWEQLGYQQENPGLRNSFLAGAYELRSGVSDEEVPETTSPDVIRHVN